MTEKVLTPSKIPLDVRAIQVDSFEKSLCVSFEVVDAIFVVDCFLDWNLILVAHGETILCDSGITKAVSMSLGTLRPDEKRVHNRNLIHLYSSIQ